jgi:hypothetical protein
MQSSRFNFVWRDLRRKPPQAIGRTERFHI